MIRAVWELTCSDCGTQEYRPIEPLPAYKIAGPNIVFSTGLDPREYLRKLYWYCEEEPTPLPNNDIKWRMLCPRCWDPTPADAALPG